MGVSESLRVGETRFCLKEKQCKYKKYNKN